MCQPIFIHLLFSMRLDMVYNAIISHFFVKSILFDMSEIFLFICIAGSLEFNMFEIPYVSRGLHIVVYTFVSFFTIL